MERPAHADLTNASFDEFVAFLFDRDVHPKSENQKPWHWDVEVKFDADRVCKHYVQLFQQPEYLKTRFTTSQLEEGFWAIQGPNLDCSAYRIIHDSDVPLSIREECIRSMYELFKRLFSVEPLDTAVHMWWDSLCYDWHCGNRKRERGGEDLELQGIFFQTFARVLAIDSEICQGAALHGLGHLHHPETPALIDRYIREHPSLSEKWKTYALGAAQFKVM